MLTYDEIIKYLSMYNYDKGNIIDKSSGEVIQDNELILKVKTAMLVYGIALDDVKTDIRDRGRSEKSKEKYIKTSMEKLGINGEINSFGFNKLINSILSSNGHYSETYSVGQNNLKESKFSILFPPKKDFTLAYLNLRFRDKGMEIDDIKVDLDETNFVKLGYSVVSVDFQLKKRLSNASHDKFKSCISHPKADLLNELEKQKREAIKNKDEVSYKFAVNNIKRIVTSYPMELSPGEFDSLSSSDKKRFFEIKMMEAKVRGDDVDFNFWKSNAEHLKFEQDNPSKSNKVSDVSEVSSKVDTLSQVSMPENVESSHLKL